MQLIKALILVWLTAVCLLSQTPAVKWEYLIASDCSVSTTCFVGEGAARKIVVINELGANGWELVSAIANGQSMVMIFKRPMVTK